MTFIYNDDENDSLIDSCDMNNKDRFIHAIGEPALDIKGSTKHPDPW